MGDTFKGAITIETETGNPIDDDVELLEMVDRQVDDGHLDSGMMQDAPGALAYVVEK
jgi:hypothetical protein